MKPKSVILALALGLCAMPVGTALAQSDLLALNSVSTERTGPSEWRLTLEFGRADRSASASARSVNAPPLGEGHIVLQTDDGIAAPFIIVRVADPSGSEIRLRAEYFAVGAPPVGDVFQVAIVGTDRIDPMRSVAPFALIPKPVALEAPAAPIPEDAPADDAASDGDAIAEETDAPDGTETIAETAEDDPPAE